MYMNKIIETENINNENINNENNSIIMNEDNNFSADKLTKPKLKAFPP